MFGRKIAHLSAVIGFAAATSSALGQRGWPNGWPPTAPFTYQGQLTSSGAPVNTPTDLRFTMYDAPAGGTVISGPLTLSAVPVVNGNFAVEVPLIVELGHDVSWVGNYHEIEVRNPAGSGSFVPLGSRQKITATPYSLATRGFSHSYIDGYMGLGGGGFTPWDDLTIWGAGAVGGGTSIRLKDGYVPDWRVVTLADELYISTVQSNSNTQTKRVVITNDGDVGIGTQAPAQALHVVGDGQQSFDGITIDSAATPVLNNSQLRLAVGGAEQSAITYMEAYDALNISHNGQSRIWVQSNGDVGIGTTEPAQELDVVGNAIVNGNLMVGGPGSPEIQLLGVGGGPKAVMSRSLSNANRGRVFILDETFGIHAGMDFLGPTNTATLFAGVKSFRTPNPDDSRTDIWYASLEGPEAAMYVRGTATLVNGHAVIELPPHFKALATTENLTVQLTPLSADSLGLAITSKNLSGIEVRELARGTGTYEFDWEVKSVRRDVPDFEVIRPWDIDRPEIEGVTAQQQWEARLADIERLERRIAELEAAKGLAQQPTSPAAAGQVLAAGVKAN